MCDITLAFGENQAYHIECPSRWSQNNLPANVYDLYKNGSVVNTYCMALGPNGGFVCSYTGKSNLTHLTTKNIPERLKKWLHETDSRGEPIRNWENLDVTLGPDGKGFWARDGQNIIWDDLPPALLATISGLLKNGSFTDCPRLVLLGMGGDCFVLTKNNVCHYSLANYPDLNASVPGLQANECLDTIEHLVLNPYKANMFGGLFCNGHFFTNAIPPEFASSIQIIEQAIRSDTQARQNQENSQAIRALNMATAQADAQSRFIAQQADFINNIGYICQYCRRNPAYCSC